MKFSNFQILTQFYIRLSRQVSICCVLLFIISVPIVYLSIDISVLCIPIFLLEYDYSDYGAYMYIKYLNFDPCINSNVPQPIVIQFGSPTIPGRIQDGSPPPSPILFLVGPQV